MTVITVSGNDAGKPGMHWEVPGANQLVNSPIPRGTRRYGSSAQIAALGANDETSFIGTLSFPTVFMYLPKSFTCAFFSDDLTSEFDNLGSLEYRPGTSQSMGTRLAYQLESKGQNFRLAVRSQQLYVPLGTWRHWIDGPGGDQLVFMLTDVSNDTSTAGDVFWTAEFWEFDIEQCFKWPVNVPTQTVNYY